MERAEKIRSAVIHVDRKGVEHYGGTFPGNILFHNALTDKQVKNINKALGTSLEYRDMVVVVDLTVFGSCKECIVFGRDGLYATGVYLSERLNKKTKLPMPVRYDQLQSPSVATTRDIASSDPSRYMRLCFADGKKPVVYMGGYAPFVVLALRNIRKELKEELPPEPPMELVGPSAARKKTQASKPAEKTKSTDKPKPAAAPKTAEKPKTAATPKLAETPKAPETPKPTPKPVEVPKPAAEAPKPATVKKSPETTQFDLEAAIKRFKQTFVLPVKGEKKEQQQPRTPAATDGPDTQFMLEQGLQFFREKDYEQAFPRLYAAAEAQHKEAWLPVAQMFHNGWGTKESKPKALAWYVLANDYCEHEDNLLTIAQLMNEGCMFEDALKYAKKAARYAPKESETLIGEIYLHWASFKYMEDDEKATAIGMYKKAVECGNGKAALALSLAYEEGKYLPRDDDAAVKMLIKAVEAGEAAAFRRLAVRYLQGDGMPVSTDDAVRCFKQGARRGDANCAYNLAVIYANWHKYSDALTYAQTAKKLGSEKAPELIARIRARM